MISQLNKNNVYTSLQRSQAMLIIFNYIIQLQFRPFLSVKFQHK